jgi:hypothetical protein
MASAGNGGDCLRLGRRLRPRPLACGRCRARRPTPGGCPRYRQAGGGPPSRSSRHRAMQKPRGGPSSVPGIISPGEITVKGAPAARRLLRNRRPLSSDLARQVLGTYRKDGAMRRRATTLSSAGMSGLNSSLRAFCSENLARGIRKIVSRLSPSIKLFILFFLPPRSYNLRQLIKIVAIINYCMCIIYY